MERDAKMTERLRGVIAKLESLTVSKELHWEKQAGSAHRYARWNNNLVILGPAAPLNSDVPRYVFITPFDAPDCIEINSEDPELGQAVLKLAHLVEEMSQHEPATDPFAVTEQLLERLEGMG